MQNNNLPTGWLPMESAPKNRAILGWCQHEADPYYLEDGKRLTLYGAHAEGVGHAADGPNIIEWGGAFDDSTWEAPGASLPDWWFVANTDFEVVANPIAWLPIPGVTYAGKSEAVGASDTVRAEFEAWLLQEQDLDGTWNEARNAYEEFPIHLAWKAWQQARKTHQPPSLLSAGEDKKYCVGPEDAFLDGKYTAGPFDRIEDALAARASGAGPCIFLGSKIGIVERLDV